MLHTTVPLADAVGKHISHFCAFDLGKNDGANHCAHLVSHLMGYEFDATCKNASLAEKQRPEKGACIRVDEIFNRLRETGPWDERPAHLQTCLIFVCRRSNMRHLDHRPRMESSAAKHIGIHLADTVWHYSNRSDQVVSDRVADFRTKFRRQYQLAGDPVEFYYGSLS
ncbi:MAG: hypothetical protein ACK4ZD_08730 [Caldimonas sp.]|uniref:hypothetical protein n=1 Tax=Caldimonas sp. TaxID=2838790 RepID=UPI00391C53C1